MRRIGFVGVAVAAAAVVASAARPAAAQTAWAGALSGAQQVPVVTTEATGFSLLTLRDNALTVDVSWDGLVGGPLAAGHIHCCTAGTAPGNNVIVAVPFVGVGNTVSGTYSNTFDLLNVGTYTSDFLSASGGTAAGARTALIAGLNANRAYVNLHDATYPNGEIRANVTAVPEPTTLALAALGLAGAGALARRRRA